MNQKYVKQSLLLLIIVMAFITKGVSAQTKVFAGSVAASSNVINNSQGLSVDGNLNTAAVLEANSGLAAGVGAYSGYLELQFPATLQANTPAYVKISMDDDILSSLAGGTLGTLTTGLTQAVLMGNQRFRIDIKNGSDTVFTAFSYNAGSFETQQLRIVADAVGNYYLMVTPNAAYNRIRITNSLGSLIGLNNTRNFYVYGAFYYTGNAACNFGTYTSYSSTGITLALLDSNTAVNNQQNAIDNSSSTFSQLKIGAVGVSASVQQTVYFEGFSNASDKYDIKLSVPQALLSAGVIDNISIIAYSGQLQVQSYNASSLIDADLLGLLQNGQPVTLTIAPGAVDRIMVRLSTLAAVTLPQSLNLYSVVKNNFEVAVTGGGNYIVGETAAITATAQGCNGPYTYVWSGDISATGPTITPPTDTPGTYNFRVTVTDGFGISKFEDVQVTVLPPPVAGTIEGGQTVCESTMPADLILTGYSGTITGWQIDTEENFSSPESVGDTDAILTAEEIGTLSETVYVRAEVGSQGYANVYTEPVALTVKSTTWDGTAWSNGTPDINTTIYIEGDYNEGIDLYGCSLTVDNNAVVVIPSGNTVTLQYDINVLSGNCTFQDNANLIQLTGASNSGNVTVIKNSNELFRLDYTFWSSPVTGQELKAFSPVTINDRFFVYATLPDQYVSVSPVNNYFQPGTGYLIRMPNHLGSTSNPNYFPYNNGQYAFSFEGKFTGVPHNGDMDIPVSSEGERANAIGNPYPSPISVEDFFEGNQANIETGNGLYFWRKRNNASATSYAVLTLEGYVPNFATGGNQGEEQYGGEEWEEYFNTTPVSQWVISQGQAFVIKAAVGASFVSFTNSMRRSAYNMPFWRTSSGAEKSRIWISLKGENSSSVVAVSYSAMGTTGIDFARDARVFTANVPVKVYTLCQEEKLAMQARPEFTDSDVVALGFNAQAAGNYTFDIYNRDGIFTEGQEVYLKDNALGTLHDFAGGEYNFTTDAGEFNNRFEIVYQQNSLSIPDYNVDDNVIVYKDGSAINISVSGSVIRSVSLYDLRGRQLYDARGIDKYNFAITGIPLQQQVLLVEVNTGKGTAVKKVIF